MGNFRITGTCHENDQNWQYEINITHWLTTETIQETTNISTQDTRRKCAKLFFLKIQWKLVETITLEEKVHLKI